MEVPADSAHDLAVNGNTASTSTDNEVTYDATDPESEASSPAFSNGAAATIPVDYTASDSGGSGLKLVELWAKKNDGSWTLADTDNSPGATGQFAYTPSDDGTYGFYTIGEDKADNREDAPSEADTTTLRDTVAPAPTLSAPPAATNDSTPEIAGTAGTQAADESHSADDDHVTVEVLDDTDTVIQTHSGVAVAPDGSFSVDADHLDDGDYTARVEQSDAAGNSDSDERDFTVDTVAPDAPTIDTGPDDPTNETTAELYVHGGRGGRDARVQAGQRVVRGVRRRATASRTRAWARAATPSRCGRWMRPATRAIPTRSRGSST